MTKRTGKMPKKKPAKRKPVKPAKRSQPKRSVKKEVASAKRGKKEAGVTLSPAELAEAIGKTTRSLNRWAADGFPKVAAKGRYNLSEVLGWYETQREELGKRPTISEKLRWEMLYRRAKAEKADDDLKRSRGELLAREEVERRFGEQLRALRDFFLRLPEAAVPRLYGKKPRKMAIALREEITTAIETFEKRIREGLKLEKKV